MAVYSCSLSVALVDGDVQGAVVVEDSEDVGAVVDEDWEGETVLEWARGNRETNTTQCSLVNASVAIFCFVILIRLWLRVKVTLLLGVNIVSIGDVVECTHSI